MTDYWFKPKTYGYGATPANWMGWVATLVFLALFLSVTWLLIMAPALARSGPTPLDLLVWLVLQIMLIASFVIVCHARTEGGWKWRWGQKE